MTVTIAAGAEAQEADYAERLKEHLAVFKRERLGVLEDGVCGQEQRAYPHILPEALKRLNVIEPVRREFWAYQQARNIKLHPHFHHLNSSQAATFNLFFPFFGVPGAPALMLDALGIADGAVTRWEFEGEPDPKEGTNVDFLIELEAGRRVLIEVKLSESGFGSWKDDAVHRERLARLYEERLRSKVVPAALVPGRFFENYQLLRNISYADPVRGDTVVLFIAPRAHAQLFQSGRDFLIEVLLPATRPVARLIALEDLVAALAASTRGGDPLLATCVALFREKYIPA